MYFGALLMNILLAGNAIASAVPSEKNGLMIAPVANVKRQLDDDGEDTSSVLVEYSASVEASYASHVGIIFKACAASEFDTVKNALGEIFVKLHALYGKCHEGISFKFEEVIQFGHVFIQLLLKFQAIFALIFNYQLVYSQCHDILFKYGFEFNEFFKFFFGYKIDLKLLGIAAGIDYNLFARIGFKFSLP